MDNYQEEVLKTLARDGTYEAYIDNDAFQRDVFGFVACAGRMESYKKQLAYGKNLPKFQTINPVRTPEGAEILHAKLGIAGEAGELFDETTREGVKNEAGDLLWYLAVLLNEHGLTFDEVMQGNIDKLRRKYSTGKFTREEALNSNIR